MTNKELFELAMQARENSYSPYSHFMVGAALLAKNGKVYTGCNIENASYTPTICAERTAFFKAVSEGTRSFERIAICGSPEGNLVQMAPPCGVCRQVMMEFCDPDSFEIVLGTGPDDLKVYTLKELLPLGFGPSDLDQ